MNMNAVCFVVALFIPYLASSGNEEYQKRALELHNEYRNIHQVGPLTLNNELNDLAAQCAQHYAKKGTIDHSCPTKTRADGSKAGENLYMSSASDMAEVKATNKWYEEVKKYNYDADSPSNFFEVGHFTQLVWKDSMELGVGVAKGSGTFCVALYSPPGNYNGKYKENVLRSGSSNGKTGGNSSPPSLGHRHSYSALTLFTFLINCL